MSAKDMDSAVDRDIAQQLQQGFDALNRGQQKADACECRLQWSLRPIVTLWGLTLVAD